MPRALWNGYISFGLVTIPVSLVTAVRDKSIHFHLLHEKDGARLRQKLVCPFDAKEVSRKDAARGFEVADGEYVIVEDDELAALEPKKSRMIEISDFVDVDQIDPVYYERPYYLVPQEGGGKPYSLLVKAMVESGKTGIGKFVFHEREHLVALRPLDGVLCLEIMRFADEIVDREEIEEIIEEESGTPDEKQLALAQELIAALAGDFEPEKYRDEYREALRELIEKKARGEEVITAPPEAEEGKVVDLMSALEKSLEQVRGGHEANEGSEKKTARRGKKKASGS
ncbi:MAG: Ku protein [Actinobacteria bacterium]|nr:Ku protein [Actinomycetota bacterium]